MKKHCAALFIDLSKAFETVFDTLLIQKHSTIGLDRPACSWFENYLKDRTRCVLTNGVKSGFLDITKGVPQGSILGPVLFTIYINSVGLSVQNCNFQLCTGDTVVYSTATYVSSGSVNSSVCFYYCRKPWFT
jgi:hypothetical protein